MWLSAADDILVLQSSETKPADKLKILEQLTRQRLARLLDVADQSAIPAKFDDIVTNVTAARFARIGNEGMQSYSQEGLSITFPDDDFAPYMAEINAYKNGDELYKPHQGRFRFL